MAQGIVCFVIFSASFSSSLCFTLISTINLKKVGDTWIV